MQTEEYWVDKATFQEATLVQLRTIWDMLGEPTHPRVLEYLERWMDGKDKPYYVLPSEWFETSIDYLIDWMKGYGR
jgi:hypothetical protein